MLHSKDEEIKVVAIRTTENVIPRYALQEIDFINSFFTRFQILRILSGSVSEGSSTARAFKPSSRKDNQFPDYEIDTGDSTSFTRKL